jgi:hypothetical protein
VYGWADIGIQGEAVALEVYRKAPNVALMAKNLVSAAYQIEIGSALNLSYLSGSPRIAGNWTNKSGTWIRNYTQRLRRSRHTLTSTRSKKEKDDVARDQDRILSYRVLYGDQLAERGDTGKPRNKDRAKHTTSIVTLEDPARLADPPSQRDKKRTTLRNVGTRTTLFAVVRSPW